MNFQSAIPACAESITATDFPAGVTEIPARHYRGCSNLKSITLPEGILKIGDSAFASCTNLINITLPNTVTQIGRTAFQHCSSLVSITFPTKGVSSMDMIRGQFEGCSSLSYVRIPEGVNKMAYTAFKGCTSLQTIELPGTLISMEESTFRDTPLNTARVPGKSLGPIYGGSGGGAFDYFIRYLYSTGYITSYRRLGTIFGDTSQTSVISSTLDISGRLLVGFPMSTAMDMETQCDIYPHPTGGTPHYVCIYDYDGTNTRTTMTFFDVTFRQYLNSESAYVHFRGQYEHVKAGCKDVPYKEFMSTFQPSVDLLDYFEDRSYSIGCLDSSDTAYYSNFDASARISALEATIPQGALKKECNNFHSPHIHQTCLTGK